MEYQTQEQWSLEAAMREETQNPMCEPSYRSPMARWAAFRSLENLELEYKSQNHGYTILAAVRVCANHDIVLPKWLAQAYIARYDTVLNCRVGSWDEAFDPPHKKGVHLNALRKRRKYRIAVWNEVNAITAAEPGVPIDKALFERIGAKLGLGATLADEYYYHAKRMFSQRGNVPARRSARSRKSR